MTNDIKDSREKVLYFLDKLILSAFEKEKSVDTKSIKDECEKVSLDVNDDFKTALENKKSSIVTTPEKLDKIQHTVLC